MGEFSVIRSVISFVDFLKQLLKVLKLVIEVMSPGKVEDMDRIYHTLKDKVLKNKVELPSAYPTHVSV